MRDHQSPASYNGCHCFFSFEYTIDKHTPTLPKAMRSPKQAKQMKKRLDRNINDPNSK